ncbi:MAG: DUF72 domain-containing protein [Desulfobacterales bacterium]
MNSPEEKNITSMKWYAHDYSNQELEEILNLIEKMKENGARKIFVFFNNDFDGHAPKNAFTFQNMLYDKYNQMD